MPKVLSPQKSNAQHVAEDRTLRRSEKYGVVGAPLFPGIDLQVDHQGRSELDTRRDVFDRIDKVRGSKSFLGEAGRSLDENSSGTASLNGSSAPPLQYVKLDDKFLTSVLRWVAGQQDTAFGAESSPKLSASEVSAKRRVVLEAVLAHRIRKLHSQSTSESSQAGSSIFSILSPKSALGRGIQSELPDSSILNPSEDEISAGLASGSSLLLAFSHSSKIVYAGQSVSKIACVSVYKHDKAVPKGYVSEVSQLNSDMRDKAVLNYSRDMQEDSYGSAPLRYLQQMSNGPPYTGILV